jgi:hypothetical protein
MASFNQSLTGFKKHIQRVLAAPGDLTVGTATGKLGFFGKAPVVRPTALTANNASTVTAAYTATEQAVIINNRTRIGEMETALKNLGILP